MPSSLRPTGLVLPTAFLLLVATTVAVVEGRSLVAAVCTAAAMFTVDVAVTSLRS